MKNLSKFLPQTTLYVLIWVIFYLITSTRLDLDFGWHLVSGKFIIANGIPAHDIYSYAMTSFDWVNHEWLNDVFVNWIYSIGGYTLLSVVFASLWTLVIWLASRKHLWFAVLLATATLFPYAGIRPVIWSALGLAILERLLSIRSKYSYLAIIGLFWFWANLHGGFALGLVLLIGAAIVRRPSDRLLLLTALGSFAVTFINPYGWKVYLEIFRTLGDTQIHNRVSEWTSMGNNPAFWIFAVLLVSTFWVVEQRKLQWRFAVPAGLLAMALSSTRHAVLFVTVSLRYLEDYGSKTLKLLPATMRIYLSIFGAIFLVVLFGYTNPISGTKLDLSKFPSSAVSYLKSNPCQGQIFNDYNFGGYLIWQLPGAKTYIDGRMPSWSDTEGSIFARYYKIFDDSTYRDREFNRYDINCVLIAKSINSPLRKDQAVSTMSSELINNGWHEAWSDDHIILLRRN